MQKAAILARFTGLLVVSLLSVLLNGCSNASNSGLDQGNGWLGIFSDRPSSVERYLVIARLKSPPLSTAIRNQNGKLSIDPDAAANLEAEQADLEAKLAEISSDIKIVFRYKRVLNAVAIDLPMKYSDQIKGLDMVVGLNDVTRIALPSLPAVDPSVGAPEQSESGLSPLALRNSVKFIGAEKLHQRVLKTVDGHNIRLDGTGVKVGVIDSGIDYTHTMFGGFGHSDDYKGIDPDQATPLFPNRRVVGGYDFAGSRFNTGSEDLSRHIPTPDANPLDEGEHGTHVAGTIGGLGDGVTSYNGVAPGADLYALKVFGKGTTSNTIVLAALDWAVDPNGDGDLSDRMDVLNLSLGHEYGSSAGLYAEAISHAAEAGIVTVASAGNEGDSPYITGAPGTSDDALSVAASIDDADQNTKIPAVAFSSKTIENTLAERHEGEVGKELSKITTPVRGVLVDMGLADVDPSPELAEKVRGKIALIARGKVTFKEKAARAAAAGAIGVVVTNNNDEKLIFMSGQPAEDIPVVMITKALGEKLRAMMTVEEVTADLTTKDQIERPEVVDTMTDFSSAGPRSGDSVIKPEITAPGANVISASTGTGDKVVKMSGTSMAGPHVAGAMALLKQARPELAPLQMKNVMMGRSVILANIGVARQGAGRLAVDRAVETPVVADRGAISLRKVQIQTRKGMSEALTLTNLTEQETTYTIRLQSRHEGLTMASVGQVTLAAKGSQTLNLDFTLDASKMKKDVEIMDGWIILGSPQEKDAYHIPVLAVVRKIANVEAGELKVRAESAADAPGAAGSVQLTNRARNAGTVLPFNLLAADARKPLPKDPHPYEVCDMQAVGYRLINKDIEGVSTPVLQFAVKLYQPMTTFNFCELSVLLDGDGDGVEDQELAMVSLKNVEGLSTPQTERNFASVLLDVKRMKTLRKEAEDKAKLPRVPDAKKPEDKLSYLSAVLDQLPLTPMDQTTLNLVEVRVDRLARTATGELSVKIATLQGDSSSDESDDFVGNTGKQWMKISLMPESQSFVGLPEKITLTGGESRLLPLKKGEGTSSLMVLLPENPSVDSDVIPDHQMLLLDPSYEFAVDLAKPQSSSASR